MPRPITTRTIRNAIVKEICRLYPADAVWRMEDECRRVVFLVNKATPEEQARNKRAGLQPRLDRAELFVDVSVRDEEAEICNSLREHVTVNYFAPGSLEQLLHFARCEYNRKVARDWHKDTSKPANWR